MKVIIIDAAAQTVEYGELGNIEAILDFFPNGISACGNLDTGDELYIDEEAMLNPVEHFFVAPCNPQPLPTKGLIVGPDADADESKLDVIVSLDTIRAVVQWLDRPAFEAWANDRGRGAAVSAGGETLETWSEAAAHNRPLS